MNVSGSLWLDYSGDKELPPTKHIVRPAENIGSDANPLLLPERVSLSINKIGGVHVTLVMTPAQLEMFFIDLVGIRRDLRAREREKSRNE